MECLLGITGKDFAITVTDTVVIRSITVLKHDEEKSRALTPHTVLAFSGESGDTINFAEYIQKNVRLYGIRHNVELSPNAVANFTRRELATSLRSRKPYQVNMLVGGYDAKKGASLYWIDYLGALAKVPYAAHGYAAFYCMSVFDRYYHEDLTLDDAMDIIRKCLGEIERRFIINLSSFSIKLINKDGISEITL
ncbi:Proteasome subunit beta type-4 [Dimargaris xerosporica]|nr:Proteasome subunit beta type-4 [Dimargaris xerosporica]